MGESSWSHAGWVSTLGKWAWLIGILNGICGIIYAIIMFVWVGGLIAAAGPLGYLYYGSYGPPVWWLIASIVCIAISFIIIRPKFSKPCGNQDWDTLYDWVLKLGGARIPWMLIWGIVLLIFSWFSWGTVGVIIPAIMLIFVGPKKYDWKA